MPVPIFIIAISSLVGVIAGFSLSEGLTKLIKTALICALLLAVVKNSNKIKGLI